MCYYREAILEDIPAIRRLRQLLNVQHHAALPEVFALPETAQQGEPSEKRLIGAEKARAFVAEDKGEIVGFVIVYLVDERHAFYQPIRYAFVESICVVESCRGQGIGRELMTKAERWAIENGAVDLRLNVWAFNEAARRLYEALGYEVRSLAMGKPLSAR
ncbi:ribosomal protein S18 acetylase RimI-like enzyme [Pseudomonas duriflava]|uniref:Ribosomal protein S18 acetylase RimI-like enzyme n=1 Tax=Pseudomonas duriflava TaxID=459528 RepID=A0A562QKV2_9PSED|nr:GNAT family N-acetyltransferase [Pseudomonas duriflava]TWI57371.1 ribosomal protein S18 acetylase RimI-like enzyme [Pseudomonas duriflava]